MASNTTTTALTAARGTLLSIALRLASFLLSQLTVRFVSAAALGKASIPLELLLSTALFVGREGFRLALTKEVGVGDDDDDDVNNDGADGAKTNAKENQQRQRREQRVANVSWLSVPAGAVLSILALSVHLRKCSTTADRDYDALSQSSSEHAALDYKLAGTLYCLASFVESLSEPLVIRCLQRMDVAAKAKAEGVALIIKSASCFGCLYSTRCSWFVTALGAVVGEAEGGGNSEEANFFAVTAFGISQLMYALTFTAIMYRKARSSIGGIRWPKKIAMATASSNNPYREKNANNEHEANEDAASATIPPNNNNFDPQTLYMVGIFTLQGLFKHALTEADKIVLSALAGSYDQGVYALASSYGGLAARFLLQPMEENARLLFSRQGALVMAKEQQQEQQCDNKKNSNTGNGNNLGSDEKDDTTTTKNDSSQSNNNASNLLKELEETYFFLIKVVLYIGLVFAAIASNYTSLLIRVLAGSRWGTNAEASAALAAFSVYTAFLALNGTTEAFVYGVARSGNEVGKLGIAHAVVGVLLALIAPGLVTRHGAVGLVASNCISMGLRSLYSLHYAHGYFAKAGRRNNNMVSVEMFRRMLPHAVVLGLFGASFVVTRASRNHIYDAQIANGGSWIIAGAQHAGVGLLCAIVIVTLSWRLETDIRLALVKLLKRKSE